ncbi:C80 family cysteine peptidase, partial [Bathymodiolus azoricus thioautotrophic gill symbiont]|uniref:C80 family cysteine peptidase n=1 Tax=Bathymodiolus azoricus thioautotrophic gill symbiont TaxID=235205 RepID=UPI0011781459
KGLKLSGANSEGSSDTIDVDSIPDILSNKQVDTETAIGSGTYKTAYNFKNQPDLLVLLLKSHDQAADIEEEIKWLTKLDSLGIKTPKRYKQITFVDESDSNTKQYGLVVQKIKGAHDIKLMRKKKVQLSNHLLQVLDSSNDQTLRDIKNLQKIFALNNNLSVSDFQGLVAEDGQLYIIDPMGVVISPWSANRNTDQLDALQTFEHYILERHNLFTDKTLDHIVYIDKQLWDAPDKTLKQKILSDAKEKNNKVIVVYDSATGEKDVIHQPSNSQNLDFATVEVISRDNISPSADLKNEHLDFAKQHDWKESSNSVFRVNTAEGYEALNLKSNDKNKHNIILSIGENKVTRDAAKALFDKHPNTSVLVTLDEQGKLVFPEGEAFTPDSSVRLNIVGHSKKLEEVGATKLADYTDQLAQHYKMDSVDSHAYLNRAALVGCNNERLSQSYAKELYTRKYLRNTSVTGRLGDIHVNEDGSKTMNEKDQKIIHRWDYGRNRSTWTTQSSKNIAKVLDHLKLGLDDETTPDSLMHKDIGEYIGRGAMKVAYTLKDHPDLLFLQLNERLENPSSIERLTNEIEWINKFREMGIKTPKYFKTLSMIDENNQEHHGILVERIHSSVLVKPGRLPIPKGRTTAKTLSDIQNLLQKFDQHPNLGIGDLQMLLGRDGQLYVMDPLNIHSPSSEVLSCYSQVDRKENIENLLKWRDESLSTLKEFDQNKGMHAIFVSKKMLEGDPKFEKSLLDKAQKQQDLVVMSYDSDGTTKVLYEPKTNYKIDRIEVMVDESNHFISKVQMRSLIRGNPKVSSDMVFRHALKEDFSNYQSNIIVQNGNSEVAVKAAQALANKHPESSIIVHFDDNNKLVTSDNEIYTPKGNVRLNFVDHGENFANGENGMDKLTDKVKQIYDTYANENTYFDRIALVGCDTSRIRQGLTRNFAKMIYDNIPALKTTEITGRKGDMQINPDGTKTMETGGEKMIYQWNGDLNVITRQTKESKRVGEILEGLKLGGANSKGSPDTDNIPNTLNSDQVDTETVVGQGVFKTAYNFKDRPNLLVLLLTSGFEASEIEEEIKHLKKLDSLGIKTPKFYKKITFIDKSNTTKHGLVVQKIKGAQDIMLSYKSLIPKGDSLLKILNNSSNQTLEDIQHLQKIFAKNATLSISDFQGLIAEDGQLYIMDPQGIDLSEKEHLDQLNALQALK